MIIEIAKQDLEAALQVVNPCMAGTGSDLSGHYTFRVQDADGGNTQFVEVLTYSNRVFSSCPLKGTTLKDAKHGDAFSVEGWRLKDWLPHTGEGVVVTIEVTGSEVEMKVPWGGMGFDSLDPSNFPWMDKYIEESTEVTVMQADRLAASIDFSRQFASDRETQDRKSCVCVIQKGVFYSTNRIKAAAVEVKGLEESTMRLHVKDAPTAITFLGTTQGEVKVLEYKRGVIFQREDGAMFGSQRYVEAIPAFGRPGEDQRLWVISKDTLKSAIGFLTAGAAKEDKKFRIERKTEDGPLTVSMKTKSGQVKTLDIPVISTEQVDGDLPDLPDGGFPVSNEFLKDMLGLIPGDTIRIGVNVRERQGEKTGFLRFVFRKFGEEKEPETQDEYLAILAWTRELGS